MIRRPPSSIYKIWPWSVVHVVDGPNVPPSTSVHLSWSIVRIRPWGGQSISSSVHLRPRMRNLKSACGVKNPSTRPLQNYNLDPASESVHKMDGRSWNFGPFSIWTYGRLDRPRTAVFVRRSLASTLKQRDFYIYFSEWYNSQRFWSVFQWCVQL